jgi:signal transduction histidine kinase
VARGGLGQLALLDQADGVLAEKMDVLAKLESTGRPASVDRPFGSAPLRVAGEEPASGATPGLTQRLHLPVSALQHGLCELRALMEAGAKVSSEDSRALIDECLAATREIHTLGAEMASEDGAGAPPRGRANLAGIVRRGVEAALPNRSDSLEIALTIERDPAPVRCQPFQLEQVVIQLVMNAADAMNGEGRVDVELRSCPEGFEVAISDSGEGIDPEVLDRLFDPFFESSAGAEAGLGLTICYRIVDQHGGELSVHSEPGRGTRVAVVLPEDVS